MPWGITLQGSSFIFPRRGTSPDLLPTSNTSLDPGDAIKSRSNVETEHGATVGEGRSGIVVDDVSDILTRFWTVDDPVVSIEWWLGTV